MPSNSKWGQLLPIILLLLLQAFWAKTMLTPALPGAEPWIGLNWVDLLFHEAGHWIFALFGQMMQFLGGSIMQLAVPAIILVSFIKQQQWLGVAFGLFWQGESLINLSYYVKDARAQLLPLIGGEHDWAWILGQTNLLAQDQILGSWLYGLGAGLIGASLIYCLWLLYDRYMASD